MPVEPTGAAAEKWSTRTGLDVRQVPWARPLAGDYAFNFSHIAPLFAGDPTSADAWRTAIARAHDHAVPRREIARMSSATVAPWPNGRAGAPNPARSAPAGCRQPEGRAFGDALQLSRRSQRSSRPPDGSRTRCPLRRGVRVDAEDHDWEEVASCTALDGTSSGTIHFPSDGADRSPSRLPLDRASSEPADLAEALPSLITDWVLVLARGRTARLRMAALRAVDRIMLGRTASSSLNRRIRREAARDRSVRQRDRVACRSAALAARGEALAARGHSPQVTPSRKRVALHLAAAAADRHQGEVVIGSRIFRRRAQREVTSSPNGSARTFCSARSCRTRFPTLCKWQVPASSRISGRSGDLSAVRRTDALMYPRATATRRFRHRAVPPKYTAARNFSRRRGG